MVEHDGVVQKEEGPWDACYGLLSVLHGHGERVRGHLIWSVFSRPAGDLLSEAQPAKKKDITLTGCRSGGRTRSLVSSFKVEAAVAAVWQLVKSWLCCSSNLLFFCYRCLKWHHGLGLTEHCWSQQGKPVVEEKKTLRMTAKIHSIPFFFQKCKNNHQFKGFKLSIL